MKCFNHHDRDAFGICKVCGKGLCLDCMSQDVEFSIYCKNDVKCKQAAEFIAKTLNFHTKKKSILSWIILLCIVAFFIGLLVVPAVPQ